MELTSISYPASPALSRGKTSVRLCHGWGCAVCGCSPLCSERPSVTSLVFWAFSSACLCLSSSCKSCASMMRLASSTLRKTSCSISSRRFSSSSSTRRATSSSTRLAVSSSIRRSSISCWRLWRKQEREDQTWQTLKLYSMIHVEWRTTHTRRGPSWARSPLSWKHLTGPHLIFFNAK